MWLDYKVRQEDSFEIIQRGYWPVFGLRQHFLAEVSQKVSKSAANDKIVNNFWSSWHIGKCMSSHMKAYLNLFQTSNKLLTYPVSFLLMSAIFNFSVLKIWGTLLDNMTIKSDQIEMNWIWIELNLNWIEFELNLNWIWIEFEWNRIWIELNWIFFISSMEI